MNPKTSSKITFHEAFVEAKEAMRQSINLVRPDGSLPYADEVSAMYKYYAMMHLLARRGAPSKKEDPTSEEMDVAEYQGSLRAFEDKGLVNQEHLLMCIEGAFGRDLMRLSHICKWSHDGHGDWVSIAIDENRYLDSHVECESVEECLEARDRLELLWRAMELRAAEGSHIGHELRDRFRVGLKQIDTRIRKANLFSSLSNGTASWADEGFWWRNGGSES